MFHLNLCFSNNEHRTTCFKKYIDLDKRFIDVKVNEFLSNLPGDKTYNANVTVKLSL